MKAVRSTPAVVAERLKWDCLMAVKQWPGCETVAEIGTIREERGLSLTVLNYGAADPRLSNRAIRAFQKEIRRHHHVAEGDIDVSILRRYHP
jgi:hypothetical protein